MNNFFEDFLSDPNQIKVIGNMYDGVFDMLSQNVEEVGKLFNISKIPTYKKIPFQMLQTNDAHFTLAELLNRDIVASMLGFSVEESFESKKIKWSILTVSEKAAIIDAAGYSIALTSMAIIKRTEYMNNIKFNVIKFDLYDKNDRLLIRNIDYVFIDNKIIIVKELEEKNYIRDSTLVLRDIIIDCSVTEDLLGSKMKIHYSNEITKNYYNSAMKAFTKASAGGPTINSLSKSLQAHSIMNGIKVYDRYNAPAIKKSFWNTYTKNGLTEFDFMVSIPLGFLYNQQKLNIVNTFFKNIKPAYTNFIFSPQLTTIDDLKEFVDIRNCKPKTAVSTSFAEKINLYHGDQNLSYQSDQKDNFDGGVYVAESIYCSPNIAALDSITAKKDSLKINQKKNLFDEIKYKSTEIKRLAVLTTEIIGIYNKFTENKIFDDSFECVDKLLMHDINRLLYNTAIGEKLTAFVSSRFKAIQNIRDFIQGKDSLCCMKKLKIKELAPITTECSEDEIILNSDDNDYFDNYVLIDKLNRYSHYDKINLLVSNYQIIKLLVKDRAISFDKCSNEILNIKGENRNETNERHPKWKRDCKEKSNRSKHRRNNKRTRE